MVSMPVSSFFRPMCSVIFLPIVALDLHASSGFFQLLKIKPQSWRGWLPRLSTNISKDDDHQVMVTSYVYYVEFTCPIDVNF